MIKNERVSKSLSRSGWAAVCALALGLLPLTPTLAQFAPATAEPTAPTAPLPPVDPAIPAPTTLEVAPVPAAEPATPATTSFNLVATVRPPTVGAPAVIETLKVRPDASISLEKPITPDGRTNFEVNPKLEDERAALRAQIKDLSKQLERAQRHLANLEATAANEKWKNYPKANKPETAPTPGGATALPSIKTKSTDKRNDYEGISRADESLRSRLDRTSAGDPRSRERRLADLETNLKILLEEVHSLKNEAQITPKRPGGGESSSYDRKDAGN